MDTCGTCGLPLEDTSCQGHERRTKIDIVFEKVVEHVDAEIKQCPNCETIAKGHFPKDMPGPLQYGNGLKAFAIHLMVSQMVALNRVQKQISAMIGVIVAEASLLKFILRLHQSLEQWELKAIDRDILSERKLRQWVIDLSTVFGSNATLSGFQALVNKLDPWLNGSIFPIPTNGMSPLRDEHIKKVASTFLGDDPASG